MRLRRPGSRPSKLPLLTLVVVLCLLVGVACSAEPEAPEATLDEEREAPDPDSNLARTASPRRYVAEWLVDAQAVGLEVFGVNPYTYIELIDDQDGTYLVVGPEHLARQTRDEVVFCAGVAAVAPACASITRPRGVPDIQSVALTKVKEWAPDRVYQLADLRDFEAVVQADPNAWQSRTGVHLGVPVRCFTAMGPNPSAPEGFDVCITDDENQLIATLDLQGDVLLDISLESYTTSVADFDLRLPADVTSDADVFDQLVYIYPQVPDIVLIDPDAEETDDEDGTGLGADSNSTG